MSWYEVLLFLHVAMAIVWVGGGLMLQIFAWRVALAREPARLACARPRHRVDRHRIFVPASLLAFLTGVLLVVESDFWGFGDSWIAMALLLYAITFFAGLLYFGPESGRDREAHERGRSRGRRPDGAADLPHARRPRPALPHRLRDDGQAGVERPGAAHGARRSRARGRRGVVALPGGHRARADRRSASAFELDERRPARHAVAFGDVHRRHGARERRVHRNLHLHRLEHDEGLPRADLRARLDSHREDGSGHRRRDRGASSVRSRVRALPPHPRRAGARAWAAGG